jgi:hypothetical protein
MYAHFTTPYQYLLVKGFYCFTLRRFYQVGGIPKKPHIQESQRRTSVGMLQAVAVLASH